ncbi:hypothetical protein EVAR_82600_1 [Eumeta japonica]|uniref:Uncharacterized protein n=1 Tax=Eumeta variegata TaxID=151549 RepID=A0A4C1X4A0_EUMVA|nr:hypothetical protein EVAR_82600_1 [Eumeta japonica]
MSFEIAAHKSRIFRTHPIALNKLASNEIRELDSWSRSRFRPRPGSPPAVSVQSRSHFASGRRAEPRVAHHSQLRIEVGRYIRGKVAVTNHLSLNESAGQARGINGGRGQFRRLDDTPTVPGEFQTNIPQAVQARTFFGAVTRT